MPPGARVLIVEDDDTMRSLLAKVLEREGCEVRSAADGSAAVRLLKERGFDLVLTDLKVPGADGLEVLRTAKEASQATEVIVMTAFGSVDSAVAAMKRGAYDYISKPFSMEEALLLVDRALEKGGLRREVERLRGEAKGREGLKAILGRSPAIKRVFDVVRSVAPSNSTVLITGRSGTGKELVARAIHENSPRRQKRFTVIHCGAIPDALLESELLGYNKGAFTGATSDRKGLLEDADGGTVFLDEVDTLSATTQAKLLRVLEDRRVRRLGGRESFPIDIRLLAASNQDLREEVRRGTFREDLFYRLDVIHIHLPDLKDRPEDIPLLAQHFLRRFCSENGRPLKGLSRGAFDLLMNHGWPGNVRELKNTMEQAALLSTTEEIRPEDVPAVGSAWQKPLADRLAGDAASLQSMERCYIGEVLRRTGGHKGRAARILGIDRRTLYNKVLKYKIGS